MGFSKEFLWGAASAAFQVEGAYLEDGKGLGIWDALAEGHIKHGEDGRVSADHYHRFREDVALMKQLGLKAYRFSVSWPRVIPEDGHVNRKGLRFYSDLVDALLEAGIVPMVTLYHWNLPMWCHEKGGWTWDGIPEVFAQYVRTVVEALSDRVAWWMTINEPLCFGGLGYVTGEHAPFLQAPEQIPGLSRNILLAHGRAVQTIRAFAKLPPKVGMALCGPVAQPEDDSAAQLEAAYDKMFDTTEKTLFTAAWWADPAILGEAPQGLQSAVSQEDMKVIHQPLDFYGFNCYHAWTREYQGIPRTAMGWPITMDALYWMARLSYQRYRLPILVTENGMANYDFIMSDGKVHDPQRIEYIHGYLKGLRRAAEEGTPILGYLHWSILDNLEWGEGYDKRFGLIYVDYRTGRRVLKDSALDYAAIIASNGETL